MCHSLSIRLTDLFVGKGGKNRRRGKNENETEKRELIFKEDGQEYAQVTKMLGNGRLEAMCFDGVKRLCHIRGKLRKKVWINQSDIILIGLRDYQDTKADVILKYTPDEARNLKTYGEFPETVRINDTVTFVEDGFDEDIEFGDDFSSDDNADPVDGVSTFLGLLKNPNFIIFRFDQQILTFNQPTTITPPTPPRHFFCYIKMMYI